jgi:hypothetical protein
VSIEGIPTEWKLPGSRQVKAGVEGDVSLIGTFAAGYLKRTRPHGSRPR